GGSRTDAPTRGGPPRRGMLSAASSPAPPRLTSAPPRPPTPPPTPTTAPNAAASIAPWRNTSPTNDSPTATSTDATSPPAKPSQVFFGLSTGVILRRPRNVPVKNAPMSPHFGTNTISARLRLVR